MPHGNGHIFVSLAYLLLLTAAFSSTNVASASIPFPNALKWTSVKETYTNTCQCDCCYKVGVNMHTECVSAEYTTFDVTSCTDCTVSRCALTFPVSCDEPTSVVNTACLVHEGWLLQLVPVVFIFVSLSLLVYGSCFKKYDGYHPVSHSEPVRPRSYSLADYEATISNTRQNVDAWPNMPTPVSRTTPTMPSIAENQELVEPSETHK